MWTHSSVGNLQIGGVPSTRGGDARLVLLRGDARIAACRPLSSRGVARRGECHGPLSRSWDQGASPLEGPVVVLFFGGDEFEKKSSPELFEDDLESASCSVTFVTVKKFSDLEKSKTAPNCLPACRKCAIHGLAECFFSRMKVTRRSIPPYVCLVIMIIRCYAPSLRFVASPSSAPPPHPLTHRVPPRTSVCSATIEPIELNAA